MTWQIAALLMTSILGISAPITSKFIFGAGKGVRDTNDIKPILHELRDLIRDMRPFIKKLEKIDAVERCQLDIVKTTSNNHSDNKEIKLWIADSNVLLGNLGKEHDELKNGQASLHQRFDTHLELSTKK